MKKRKSKAKIKTNANAKTKAATVFLKIPRSRGLRFKKILYIPAVFLILLCGIYTFPISESGDPASLREAGQAADSAKISDADSVVLTELSIDVGQGDATLIQCDGHAMLIDTGDNSKGTAVQLYLTKQGIGKLDYLVLTHPDADHIGGADVIITKFDIDRIFMSDYVQDTKTYEDVLNALQYRNESWSMPSAGNTYALGDADFTILAPLNTYDNANDSSIALILTHGEKRFLFTGDCSENAEKDLAACRQNLSADVYQAGHHGSRYSSSQTFMDAVSPTYAVISCGKDNSYGHPSAEVLNRFRAMGIQVFRTDEQGSIVATSDGTDITWNRAPSDTWKAGEPTVSSSDSTSQDTAAADNTPASAQFATDSSPGAGLYIGSKNTRKLHRSSCRKLPPEKNQAIFNTREAAAGYNDPCKICNP